MYLDDIDINVTLTRMEKAIKIYIIELESKELIFMYTLNV